MSKTNTAAADRDAEEWVARNGIDALGKLNRAPPDAPQPIASLDAERPLALEGLVGAPPMTTGLDAERPVHLESPVGLEGLGMFVVNEPDSAWEQLAPAKVAAELHGASLPSNGPRPKPEMKALHGVYLFRTREGGQGLLKIEGSTSHPAGVKIRYKLLQ